MRFDGVPPVRKPVDRHSDPYCERTPRLDESVVVARDGAVRDVFIRVTGGLPPAPPPASPVVLEQRACAYVPRVQGMVAGQPIEVRNGDATLHNVHIYRGRQTVLNRSQKEGSAPMGTTVAGPPALLEVRCDVHPWMLGHVWVSADRWFAVTGDDGRFAIAGVPAGRHTITAWHEALGEQAVETDVAAGGAAELDLPYRAAKHD